MIKGLVGGLRTLVLAFALLFVVLYIIAVFATITIGRGADLDRLDGLRSLFRRGVAGCRGQMTSKPLVSHAELDYSARLGGPMRAPKLGTYHDIPMHMWSCAGRFHQPCSQLSAAILENASAKMGCQ
jgi:hypothetical protein